jgi:hypothetical protein
VARIAGLLLVGACAWDPWVPDRPDPLPETSPGLSRALVPGEALEGELRCAEEQRCNDWYRLLVEEPGWLRVRVDAAGAADGGRMRLLLRRMGGPVVSQVVSESGPPLVVDGPVEPGVHAILVQGGGARVPYRIVADWADPES